MRAVVVVPLVLACALVPLAPAAAATPSTWLPGTLPGATSSAEPVTPEAVTPEAAQAFLDTRVPELLEEHGVPGAVASVVADGREAARGGYGEADAAAGTPVDPDTHHFPLGSAAKSFTAVAVLQLVDEGRVDLHEDVNTYLPEYVRIPDTHPGEPVTLHHLLSHSAGFEEAMAGEAAADPDDLLPLAEHLAQGSPDRVYAPGEFVSYSNYSLNLAGLVVQEVSGQPFEDYAREHVFEPLGMGGTAFGHIHELAESHDLPLPHDSAGGTADDLHLPGTPSGLAVAPVSDVSRFMLALLGGGELDGTRVLSEESAALMLDRHAGTNPGVTGPGYGIWERRLDEPRVLGHGGDLPGYHTVYVVVPETDIGAYIALNGDGVPDESGRRDLRTAFAEEFVEKFAPVADDGTDSTDSTDSSEGDEGAADTGGAAAAAERYTGTYVTTRLSHGDASSITALVARMTARAQDDGTLVLSGEGYTEQPWRPLGGGVFESEDGLDRVGFTESDGRVTGLSFDADPTSQYERVGLLRSPVVHTFTGLAALALLATVLVWPVVSLVRVLRGRPAPPRGSGWARWAAATAAAGVFASVGLLVYLIGTDQNRFLLLLAQGSPVFAVPLTVAVPFTVAALVGAVASWRGRWWSVVGRLHYSLVALAALAMVVVGGYYRLVWLPV